MSLKLLSRRLQACLRSGAFDDVALARVMNHAIGGADLHPEAPARRSALIAMATAMARDILRHRRTAILGGRLIRAWFLTSLLHTVLEWAYEMTRADPDPDADMLRVRSLQLQLHSSELPEARDLRTAAAAMARVGLAGTSPVH